MKYPKDIGPQSSAEIYAWLFGALGNAWNIIAQYEADEEDERRLRMEEAISREDYKARRDPSKSTAAHREDEQQ